MRLSCNGCRVLRKGCSEDCCIRPSLQWIKSPEAQANATLFLAKFYGRAGLLNLLRTGPDHIRPSIFRSLLQEACGRIVNPVYGSSGLISTGTWHLCEAAVEAVLAGSPITQLPIESAVENISPVFKTCDIRHVLNNETSSPMELNKVKKKRSRFKWSKPRSKKVQHAELVNELSVGDSVGQDDSGVTHSRASDLGSLEGVEDTLAKTGEVGLDLTLGFSHKVQQSKTASPESTERFDELTLGSYEIC